MGLTRKMLRGISFPFEVIAALVAILLGGLLLLAIEVAQRLHGQPAGERKGLLSERREETRLLGDGATQKME
jgi:hypothetical protein